MNFQEAADRSYKANLFSQHLECVSYPYTNTTQEDLHIGDWIGYGILQNPYPWEEADIVPKGASCAVMTQGLCFVSERVAAQIINENIPKAHIFGNGDKVVFSGFGFWLSKIHTDIPEGMKILYLGDLDVNIEKGH